jgi:hypothetical protein
MDLAKIQIIQDWPEPQKVKDVQAFLRFANFYRRFIWNYSEIVIPLTRLTRKNIPWLFSEDCRKAFSTLKEAFITAPVLTHYVPDARITVKTDASDYAISGILSIDCLDKEIRLIAFYSWTLNGAELNYDTYNKELLAIFEAFQQWCHYLEGSRSPVNVITDHKNLEYFATTKMLTRWQACWLEYLSQFNLIIRFRPGHLRAKPDALTRRWDIYPKEGDSGYASVNPHNIHPVFTQEQLSFSLRATYLAKPTFRAAHVVDSKQLHNDICAALPTDPVAAAHIAHPEGRWTYSDGLLFLDSRTYVPASGNLRLRVLRDKHDHPLSGHFRQNRTLSLIQREFVWPKM